MKQSDNVTVSNGSHPCETAWQSPWVPYLQTHSCSIVSAIRHEQAILSTLSICHEKIVSAHELSLVLQDQGVENTAVGSMLCDFSHQNLLVLLFSRQRAKRFVCPQWWNITLQQCPRCCNSSISFPFKRPASNWTTRSSLSLILEEMWKKMKKVSKLFFSS